MDRLHAATKKILLMWDRVARCNGLVLLCGIGLCVATDINSTIWDRFVRRNNIIYFWIGIFSTTKEICFVFTFVYRVVRHNREDMFCIYIYLWIGFCAATEKTYYDYSCLFFLLSCCVVRLRREDIWGPLLSYSSFIYDMIICISFSYCSLCLSSIQYNIV